MKEGKSMTDRVVHEIIDLKEDIQDQKAGNTETKKKENGSRGCGG